MDRHGPHLRLHRGVHRAPRERRIPRLLARSDEPGPRGGQSHVAAPEVGLEPLPRRNAARDDVATRLRLGQLRRLVDRPTRGTQDERAVLVRHEAGQRDRVDRAAAGGRRHVVVRVTLGHEQVRDGHVLAPGPLQGVDVPVAVQRRLLLREREPEGDGWIALPDVREPTEPFRVLGTARERPATGEAIAALDALGMPVRRDAARGAGQPPIDEEVRDPLVRHPGGHEREGARPHEHAPAGGRVDVRQALDDLDLRDRVGLEPAELARRLQPEQPGVVQRTPGRLRQRPDALGLVGTRRERVGDRVDLAEQVGAQLRLVGGDGRRAGHAPRKSSTSGFTVSGCSHCGTWPAPAMISTRAPGMWAAKSSA